MYQNTVIQNDKIIINNKEVPDLPHGQKPHTVITINGTTYINGYQMINGKWRRTAKSLFHSLF